MLYTKAVYNVLRYDARRSRSLGTPAVRYNRLNATTILLIVYEKKKKLYLRINFFFQIFVLNFIQKKNIFRRPGNRCPSAINIRMRIRDDRTVKNSSELGQGHVLCKEGTTRIYVITLLCAVAHCRYTQTLRNVRKFVT